MLRLDGIAAGGIAVGRAHVLDRRRLKITRRRIRPGEVAAERERFLAAVEATERQFERLQEKLDAIHQGTHILEAHRLIVRDPHLIARTLHHIQSREVNAEWALRETMREIRKAFDQVDDQYFQERRADVDFGVRHLLVNLMGDLVGRDPVPRGAVVLTYDLSPAEVARLQREGAVAVVTEVGGATSHTVIMARSLGLACVVGVRRATAMVAAGDELIVDGDRGEIIVCPDERTRQARARDHARRAAAARQREAEAALPLRSRDGARVAVLANVGLTEEISRAAERGVEGIGLFRTEFLFLDRQTLPSEEEHAAHTRRALLAAGRLPVTFRTCDLNLDALLPGAERGREPNPAMGQRALRLHAARPELLRTQLRGMLRGAQGLPLRVMFPLVSGLGQWREARELTLELAKEVHPGPSSIELGLMIELPATALTLRHFIGEIDFVAIGTNDLIQYALGVDRANERVSELYQPLHPAVLQLVRGVVEISEAAMIPLTVCGEMAGDPLCTLCLLGMGVRRLSMGPAAVPLIKHIVAQGSLNGAERLYEHVVSLSSAEEIEAVVRESLRDLVGSSSPALAAVPSAVTEG